MRGPSHWLHPRGPVCVSDVKWIDITPDMMVQERSFDADCKRLSPGEFRPQASFALCPEWLMSLLHCPCILCLFQIGASVKRWSQPWQHTWAKTTAMVSVLIAAFALRTWHSKALKSQETGYSSQGAGNDGWVITWFLDRSTTVKLPFWVNESKHKISNAHKNGLSEKCCAQSGRGCFFSSGCFPTGRTGLWTRICSSEDQRMKT